MLMEPAQAVARQTRGFVACALLVAYVAGCARERERTEAIASVTEALGVTDAATDANDASKSAPGAAPTCSGNAACNDGNACTTDKCSSGKCSHTAVKKGI